MECCCPIVGCYCSKQERRQPPPGQKKRKQSPTALAATKHELALCDIASRDLCLCALAVHFLFHSRLPLCGLHPQQQQQRPPAKWVSAALSSTGQQQEQSDQSSLIGGADGHASEPSHKPSSKASFNASLIGEILSPLTERRRRRRQFAEIAFLSLPAHL